MREGQHAHFECKLEPVTDSNLKVEWYKNGRPITVGKCSILICRNVKKCLLSCCINYCKQGSEFSAHQWPNNLLAEPPDTARGCAHWQVYFEWAGGIIPLSETYIFSVLTDFIETDVKHLVVHVQSFIFSRLASSSLCTNNLQVL